MNDTTPTELPPVDENETREQAIERIVDELTGARAEGANYGAARVLQCLLITHPKTLKRTLRLNAAMATYDQDGSTPQATGSANFALGMPLDRCHNDPELAKVALLLALRRSIDALLADPAYVDGVQIIDTLEAAERERFRRQKLADQMRDPDVPLPDKLAGALRASAEAAGFALDVKVVDANGLRDAITGDEPAKPDDSVKH